MLLDEELQSEVGKKETALKQATVRTIESFDRYFIAIALIRGVSCCGSHYVSGAPLLKSHTRYALAHKVAVELLPAAVCRYRSVVRLTSIRAPACRHRNY